jgi:peptide-methionine (R)-S-oxide reductase
MNRRTFIKTACLATSGILLPGGSAKAEFNLRFVVVHTPAEWLSILGPERFAILRQGATELPFSSQLVNEYRRGLFMCAGCAQPIFSSATKFDSGTGWPSFFEPIFRAVVTRPDRGNVADRVEVLCAQCGGHLGHVFDDGPRPTGLRYCINGLALTFRPTRS